MIEIPLTQGKVALVDDDDYEFLSQFKWHAHFDGTNWYARSRRRQRVLRMHNVIMSFLEGYEIDHKDGDGLNNQRYNLRVTTHTQNMKNQRLRSNNTSGYKGVTWHKGAGKWYAQIQVDGKRTYLGLFTILEDAARAYDTAALEHYGEFARLNLGDDK